MPRGLPWGRRSNKPRARQGGWITATLVCLAQGADSHTLHRNEGDSRDNSYRRPGAPSQVSFSERKGSEGTDNDDTHLAYGGYQRDRGHREVGEHEGIGERRKDGVHEQVSPVGAWNRAPLRKPATEEGCEDERFYECARHHERCRRDTPVADDHRIPQGLARNGDAGDQPPPPPGASGKAPRRRRARE